MKMPTSLFSRVNLDLLYPPFVAAALTVVAECRDRGWVYSATEGFRSFARSDELAVLGTGAPAGKSAHNYGLALDFVHNVSADLVRVNPDWMSENYSVLGEVAEAHGLVWGGHFHKPDPDHLNWPLYSNAHQLAALLAIKQMPGELTLEWLRRVWAYIDSVAVPPKETA